MRTILHVDLDAFFCAIEEQRDPALRGKAFAVGGQPDQRGVVASCSYPARQHGVRSAMPMARAVMLCPGLIVVPARHAAYRAASNQVMALLHELTPQVEQLSIDEAFLDVSDLLPFNPTAQEAHVLAQGLQQRIERELGLSCSMGIASNKMVAKIATDYGKANAGQFNAGQTSVDREESSNNSNNTRFKNSPRAICAVPHGEEAAFLAPLPVSALWGVGPKTEAALTALGLMTIGDLAAYPAEELLRRFGQHGYDLARHARGIDQREIVTQREVKSVSSETTFVQDVTDWDELHKTIKELVGDVVRRLQRHQLRGSTIKLKLRWSDFTTPTRQLTLPSPTDDAAVIHKMANQLFGQLWQEGTPVRLLGVGVSGLSPRMQLGLWDEIQEQGEQHPEILHPEKPQSQKPQPEKEQKIEQAIKRIQQKFGKPLVQRGWQREKRDRDEAIALGDRVP